MAHAHANWLDSKGQPLLVRRGEYGYGPGGPPLGINLILNLPQPIQWPPMSVPGIPPAYGVPGVTTMQPTFQQPPIAPPVGGGLFCSGCGNNVGGAKFCPSCGKPNDTMPPAYSY